VVKRWALLQLLMKIVVRRRRRCSRHPLAVLLLVGEVLLETCLTAGAAAPTHHQGPVQKRLTTVADK